MISGEIGWGRANGVATLMSNSSGSVSRYPLSRCLSFCKPAAPPSPIKIASHVCSALFCSVFFFFGPRREVRNLVYPSLKFALVAWGRNSVHGNLNFSEPHSAGEDRYRYIERG